MREILFRGKLNNGKWAYGNLEVKTNGVCIITPDDTPLGSYGQVYPETVGQYTGLTDKNGTMIFEGDIVTVLPECEEGVIEWDNESARFVVIMDDVLTDFDNYWGADLEVTRTVHDIPETLKGW